MKLRINKNWEERFVMARSISKRKKPSKDDFQLKERFKTESEVFDRQTLIVLSKLIKKGILQNIDYPISTGKEANVFRATTNDGTFVAVKIYKRETSPFARKEAYLDGDPRFERIKHSDKEIVKAFTRKEFKNLELCQKGGVHTPKPYYVVDNVIVMEFIGDHELPYPTLNVIGSQNPEKDLEMILEEIKKMYKVGLVHADLSEYNIIMKDVPYLIDFGQGVITRHPAAGKFLERDVMTILKYFAKRGAKRDLETVLKWIKEEN